jgi:hypothetical protein
VLLGVGAVMGALSSMTCIHDSCLPYSQIDIVTSKDLFVLDDNSIFTLNFPKDVPLLVTLDAECRRWCAQNLLIRNNCKGTL